MSRLVVFESNSVF